MDIGRAFSALTKDPRWKGKIAVGVLISLVPIVNLAAVGWGIRYVAMCASGRDTELPDHQDLQCAVHPSGRLARIMRVR